VYTVKTVARGALQRDVIVRRALQVADTEGLSAVSFRRLAAAFAVTPMALYRHVRDRNDLLDAMADLLLAEIQLSPPDDDGADWVESLRRCLQSAGRMLSAHPAASDLLRASTGRSPNSLRLTEALLEILIGAGFSPAEALVVVQQLSSLLLASRPVGGEAQHHSEQTESSVPTCHADREEGDRARPPDMYPYLRATLPQAGRWVDAGRDRAFGVELLLAGVETLLARKRAGGAPAASVGRRDC